MSTKTTLIISISLIIIGTLAGLLLWNQLPDQVASHWGVNDQVNGYMPKLMGVLLMPAITTFMLVLFILIPSIDPLKANIAQFLPYFNTFIALLIAFMVYVHALTLIWNIGMTGFRMSAAMLPALGLLFVFMGPLISNSKRNYFIGIRTPWTLSSDTVWEKTHRLGGKLFTAAGIFALLGAFIPDLAVFFVIIPITLVGLFTVVYSYFLYVDEQKGK